MDLLLQNTATELPLPSDEYVKNRILVLETKVRTLESINEALRIRLEQTLADWKEAQNKLQDIETSDILCDFIAEFYHCDLLCYLRQQDLGAKKPPASWTELSLLLVEEAKTNAKTIKEKCMQCADLSEAEWDALYNFKRSRNVRVHPKRNKFVVRRVLRGLSQGTLKSALTKMLTKMVK